MFVSNGESAKYGIQEKIDAQTINAPYERPQKEHMLPFFGKTGYFLNTLNWKRIITPNTANFLFIFSESGRYHLSISI